MSDIPADRAVRTQRDLRLDVFRGLALVMIFINHVPGTVYENFTNRNFGLSDAAEGFVLMSGVAAGLAYSPLFRAPPGGQASGASGHASGRFIWSICS